LFKRKLKTEPTTTRTKAVKQNAEHAVNMSSSSKLAPICRKSDAETKWRPFTKKGFKKYGGPLLKKGSSNKMAPMRLKSEPRRL
jgi:hypothetical protein